MWVELWSSDRKAHGRTSRFLDLIEILQVPLGFLEGRGGVACAGLIVSGDNDRGVQSSQCIQRRDPILAALGGAAANVPAASVVHNISDDDQTDRWHVDRGGIGRVGAALRSSWPSRVSVSVQDNPAASASASATVIIASTSTALCSPRINVDVIGSKPSGSPKGLGRSPTIALPGAVKMLTPSEFGAAGLAHLFSPLVSSTCHSQAGTPVRRRADSQSGAGQSIGRMYRVLPKSRPP
jgi:hypothetical protein